MIAFILRRLILMVFTLAGVILLTFVLFNVVGGSPAKAILGEKASPDQLEDFESVRGLNKPLFYGHWSPTRALEDRESPASKSGKPSEGPLPGDGASIFALAQGMEAEIPFAFPLSTNEEYRLELEYQADQAAKIRFGQGAVSELPARNEQELLKQFRFRPFSEDFRVRVEAGEGDVHIHAIRLRRFQADPWDSQFRHYLKQIVTFDFGTSHFTRQRVSQMLKDGIGPTLMLAIPVLIGGVLISLFLSLMCAYYRDRWPDRILVLISVGLMSINYLVWIVAGQYVLAYQMGWFPVWGFESWSYLLLPVGIGIISGLGQDLRLYRTVMLDEMYRDYVRTAYAKGCSTPRVLFRHVLRNALIPVVTNLSMVIPFLYTGSLLLETYFGIPGLGYISINGIFNKDVDVVRAVVLIGSILYMISNLIADLLYAVLDPRVKLS